MIERPWAGVGRLELDRSSGSGRGVLELDRSRGPGREGDVVELVVVSSWSPTGRAVLVGRLETPTTVGPA